MVKVAFSDVIGIVGIILTIVVFVLDKAGKLKGNWLLFLLIVAAGMTLFIALGNSWVVDAPAKWRFWRGMLMLCVVGLTYSGLAIWISPAERPSLPTTSGPVRETRSSEAKPEATVNDDKIVPRNKPDKVLSATPMISLEMNPGIPPSDCPHVLFLEPSGGGISGMWIEELPRDIPMYDSHGNLYSIGPLFQKWTALNPGKDTLLNVSITFPVVFAENQDFNKKPYGQAKLEIGALPPNVPYLFVISNRSQLWARLLKPQATFDLSATLRDKPAEVVLGGWGKGVGSGFFPPAANPSPRKAHRVEQDGTISKIPKLACVENHTQGLYDIYAPHIGHCLLIQNVEDRYPTMASVA